MFLFNIVSLTPERGGPGGDLGPLSEDRSRVFYFLMGNFLTFLILAVLTWDLYCSILGRDTRLRTDLWSLIDFCVCRLCAAIPHTIRPISPRTRKGGGAGASARQRPLLALLRLLG